MEFSPWVTFGPPITLPKLFSIADTLKKAHADHIVHEDADYGSEDERDIDNTITCRNYSTFSP